MGLQKVQEDINETIFIDGKGLKIEDIVAVARYNARVKISPGGWRNMEKSSLMVENLVKKKEVVYGITTGFGKFSDITISQDQTEQLQENLIVSHAVGVGNHLPEEVVRAIMLLRANTLARGHSGIRPQVVQTLVDMINKKVHPAIPEKGSLGASGDLAPLAHMVLVMIGKGKAYCQGELVNGDIAMMRAGIPIVKLKAKEGLALINGTQVMTAFGALAVYDSEQLARTADISAALTCEALEAILSAYDIKVHNIRPHNGQINVANNMLSLLKDSEIINDSKHNRVQDAYAIRCVPQVHGASRDAIAYARKVIEIEINSVTDNPLIFPDDNEVISGGNFHGQPVALAMDFLGIAVAELANIAERRIERLVNPALSNLPPFLTEKGGINSGFMIVQYVAASLVSENKVLAHPASVDSIPSSANQEDHVSMGTISARKAREIIDNVKNVLAIELLCASQGIDLRKGLPAKATGQIHKLIREKVAKLDNDREMWGDIETIVNLINQETLIKVAKKNVPDFQ